MFNNSVLNVIAGLVFIFLLYSLFATGLQEALSNLFQRRASLLYKGIKGMLTNSNRRKGILPRLVDYVTDKCRSFLRWVKSWYWKDDPRMLHEKFYAHPIIKNYGENALYNKPSYLSSENFATILIDTIKNLDPANELVKADFALIEKTILQYSKPAAATGGKAAASPVIDEDTFKILHYHLNESAGSLDIFTQRLEQWFNDSMDKVSEWYKRTTHVWLFCIGMLLALVLNIDSIQLSTYLSKNRKTAEQLAEIAAAAASNPAYNPSSDSGLSKEVIQVLRTQNDSVTTLLGLGWGDYGRKDTAFIHRLQKHKPAFLANVSLTDSIPDALYEKHGFYLKTYYIYTRLNWTHFFGFFITAIAISLGAPFWFDLLNRVMNLRSAGRAVERS